MRIFCKGLGLLCIGAVAAVVVSACGGGGDSTASSTATSGSGGGSGAAATSQEGTSEGGGISIDVGTTTLEYPAGTKPKIAMFAASGEPFQDVGKKRAEEEASKYGYELTFYDSKFDPTTQLNEMQNALSGGEYNAWLVESDAGQILCSTVKKAGEDNIAIVQLNNFTCDQGGKPAGEESWTPGTVASVNGSITSTYYEAFAKEVKETIPSDAEVGVISGPPTSPTSAAFEKALEDAGIDAVNEVNTNFLTPEGLKEAQTMLQAHSGLDVLISIYSDLTVGAAQAIDADGKTGEIEVFDLGGSSADVKLIEEGKLTLSAPYFPGEAGQVAVEALDKAFNGEPVEKFYPALAKGTPEEPFFVTKETVGSFKAEY